MEKQMNAKNQYSVFDNMIEGVQVIDYNYRYLYVNDVVVEHGKYTRAQLVGHTMSEKYPGIERTDMFGLIQKCMNERIVCQMDNEFTFPDGSKGYFELRMQPVPEGVQILSIDITTRKTLRLAIEEQNKKLQSQNKILEQFVYIASHDLQEPLRTVNSFVELLEMDYKHMLDDEGIKYLGYISGASERMKALVRGLLDYSRIGEKNSISTIDCNVIIQNVLNDLSVAITESNAVIKVDSLPVIKGYEVELRLLFQNIINNAIKFRREKMDPQILIVAEKCSNHWLFKVKDNGIGFDIQFAQKIFTIFQRLHLRSEYNGTGIGLAHCKKIVELHGGDIWAESTPNNGSIFSFTIPYTITNG